MWRSTWLFNAVLAVVSGTFVVLITALIARWHQPLDTVYYVWLGGTALPLVLRTRFPLVTFVITAVLTVGYFYFSPFPYSPLPALSLIALITASYMRGPWLTGTIGVVIVAVGQLLAWRFDSVTFGVAFGMLLWITAGCAIGAAARWRRERTVEHSKRIAEKERLYIAREVHDVVAHSLAMINVQAGVGAHIADKRPDQAKEALLAIKEASRVALADLRATLGVVRSEDRSPIADLDRLPELVDAATAAGLNVEQRGTSGEVPAHVSLAAYRIVQEAFTNTIRHARDADTVVVEFRPTDAELTLLVTDNGTAPTVGVGNGLRGMRERVEALGGSLVAGPATSGFQVRAVLPLRGEPA